MNDFERQLESMVGQWESALAALDRVDQLLQEHVHAKAPRFASNVEGSVASMRTWIRTREHVTSAQWRAIINWQSACRRIRDKQ